MRSNKFLANGVESAKFQPETFCFDAEDVIPESQKLLIESFALFIEFSEWNFPPEDLCR